MIRADRARTPIAPDAPRQPVNIFRATQDAQQDDTTRLMVASEHAARLIASIAALDRAAQDAVAAVGALSAEGGETEAGAWLPGIRQSLARIQLECTDLSFAARSLREALPSSTTLQPRLI